MTTQQNKIQSGRFSAFIGMLFFLTLTLTGCGANDSSNSSDVATQNNAPPTIATMQNYHGFQIDNRLVQDQKNASVAATILPSVLNQIAIVETVRLPAKVIDFFRQVPIVIDPAVGSQVALFKEEQGKPTVRLALQYFPENKPVLLHEMLHAYHSQVLGLNRSEIITAYQIAKTTSLYPEAFKRTHFLSNAREFFAVTSSIYLFGVIQQAPFNCTVLAQTNAQYLSFLASLFDSHSCTTGAAPPPDAVSPEETY